jgi:hypothetical protein
VKRKQKSPPGRRACGGKKWFALNYPGKHTAPDLPVGIGWVRRARGNCRVRLYMLGDTLSSGMELVKKRFEMSVFGAAGRRRSSGEMGFRLRQGELRDRSHLLEVRNIPGLVTVQYVNTRQLTALRGGQGRWVISPNQSRRTRGRDRPPPHVLYLLPRWVTEPRPLIRSVTLAEP